MHQQVFYRILFAGLALLLIAGCDGDSGVTPNNTFQILRLEPLPDEEAELIALYLSKEIEAPLELYNRVRADLRRIRSSAAAPDDVGRFSYRSRMSVSHLTVRFFPGARERIEDGQSPVWDSLAAIYHPTVLWDSSTAGTTEINFPGRLLPSILSRIYGEVPEIQGILGSFYFDPPWAGYQRIYPRQLNETQRTYVFHSFNPIQFPERHFIDTFWCFYAGDRHVEYAGTYSPSDHTPIPVWWQDFCHSVDAFASVLVVGGRCARITNPNHVTITDQPSEELLIDSYTIGEASLHGDQIRIPVSYGGGCRRHSFQLYMSPPEFGGAHQREAELYLQHDAHGDMCRALLLDTLVIDLTPLAEHYQQAFGQVDDITLNLHDFDLSSSQSIVYSPLSTRGYNTVLITRNSADTFVEDAFSIVSTRLEDNTLSLDIRSSGGCLKHSYKLYKIGTSFAESNPVQTDIVLWHNDYDDPCDAIVTDRIAFDLSSIMTLYVQQYGQPGPIQLNILNYEQDDAITILYNGD